MTHAFKGSLERSDVLAHISLQRKDSDLNVHGIAAPGLL